MLLSGMVSYLPPSIDYRAFPDFDNAVASVKTGFCGRLYEVDMCPLKPVVMDIVGDFAKQDSAISQDTVCFRNKWRIGVGKAVVSFD